MFGGVTMSISKINQMIRHIASLLLFIGLAWAQPSQNDTIDIQISVNDGWLYKDAAHFSQNSAGLLTLNGIKLKNQNIKTIKYLTVEVNAYNRVDDLISAELGGNNFRVTGPIKFNETYTLNTNWKTYYDVNIKKLSVRIISVEYMDGEIKNVPTKYFTTSKDMLSAQKKIMKDLNWQFGITIVLSILYNILSG